MEHTSRNSTVSRADLNDIRALTTVDTVTVLVAITLVVLVIWAALPTLHHDRVLSPRTVCAANLKGIGNAFTAYAAANNECWPIPAHMPPSSDNVACVIYAPGKIGTRRGVAGQAYVGESSEQDSTLSTTRVFWEQIRGGAASPKCFICPVSKDEPNNEDRPQDFWDFRRYSEISYGYQVPFGKKGKPRADADMDMALAADKGPFGAALEAGRPHPGVPTAKTKGTPAEWEPWNSPNHEGEGQNVLYGDTHVDFCMTPLAGWKKDNIYTRWSQADADKDENELARVQGTPPTGIETPWGDTDSLIYP